jgi:hypothetical protein
VWSETLIGSMSCIFTGGPFSQNMADYFAHDV